MSDPWELGVRIPARTAADLSPNNHGFAMAAAVAILTKP
jgi:hypothetical protein